jgi:TPR repeat protein
MIMAVVLGVLSETAAPGGALAQSRAPCSLEQYVPPEPPVDARKLEQRVRSDARIAAQAGDSKLLLKICCQAAAAGIPEAEAMLGVLSAEGAFGVPKNEAQARYWLERASRQGHAKAMLGLSQLYEEGRGGPEMKTDALILLKKAAQAGLPEAQFLLGLQYVLGEALPRDVRAGYEWLKRAEAAGHSKAADIIREIRAQYPELK